MACSNSLILEMTLELAGANLSSSFTLKISYWPRAAVDFSAGGKSELKTWALDVGFDLPTSHTEIREIITNFNFVDSALGQTQRYDSERHQDLLKAILCVNFNLL